MVLDQRVFKSIKYLCVKSVIVTRKPCFIMLFCCDYWDTVDTVYIVMAPYGIVEVILSDTDTGHTAHTFPTL